MSSEKQQYDVVVIGGGPCGSSVAAFVAMQGHRVLLLERERFPRYQIGESLLPSTIHGICKLLGVHDEVKAAGFMYKRGGTWRWGANPEPWSFDFNDAPVLARLGQGHAYQVERAKFDNILLNNARRHGTEVREEHRVTGIVREGERIVGVTFTDAQGTEGMVRARYVVDASGHASRLHREVGQRKYSDFFRNLALFSYWENGKRLAPPMQGNILCAVFDKGWFWYIPLSDTLTSVGAVVGREHADSLKQDPDVAMRGFIDSCPMIREYLSSATRVTEGMYGEYRIRKDYSYTTSRYWIPGLALAGDAACFVDPVLSSGVHLATYSALLVSRAVNSYLRGGIDERKAFDEFEYRYRTEFEVTYNFLVSFYDMQKLPDSYFWSAHQIMNSSEQPNHAFLQMVSGGATTASDFWARRVKFGMVGIDEEAARTAPAEAQRLAEQQLQEAQRVGDVHRLIDPNVPFIAPRPVREGGLVPSRDMLHWEEPAEAAVEMR